MRHLLSRRVVGCRRERFAQPHGVSPEACFARTLQCRHQISPGMNGRGAGEAQTILSSRLVLGGGQLQQRQRATTRAAGSGAVVAPHDVQHHAGVARIGAVAVALPIARAPVQLDRATHFAILSLQDGVEEVWPGVRVTPPRIDHAYALPAQERQRSTSAFPRRRQVAFRRYRHRCYTLSHVHTVPDGRKTRKRVFGAALSGRHACRATSRRAGAC